MNCHFGKANALRRFSRFCAVLCVGAALSGGFFATSAFAQRKSREERREEANSRALQGIVTNPDDMPAQGAVVQLKDMRTLQVRSYITQADGSYHFSGLKADVDYQISARSGDNTAGPKTLSVFDSRKDAVLNFKLEKK
jgi:hypothetical protein